MVLTFNIWTLGGNYLSVEYLLTYNTGDNLLFIALFIQVDVDCSCRPGPQKWESFFKFICKSKTQIAHCLTFSAFLSEPLVFKAQLPSLPHRNTFFICLQISLFPTIINLECPSLYLLSCMPSPNGLFCYCCPFRLYHTPEAFTSGS